jgi:hypothetical protein
LLAALRAAPERWTESASGPLGSVRVWRRRAAPPPLAPAELTAWGRRFNLPAAQGVRPGQ